MYTSDYTSMHSWTGYSQIGLESIACEDKGSFLQGLEKEEEWVNLAPFWKDNFFLKYKKFSLFLLSHDKQVIHYQH